MQNPDTPLRVHKVPDFRLDPDWGHVYPDTANAYIVTVSSSTNGNFNFVLLLPDAKNASKLISLVLKEFLNREDSYIFRDFTEQDLKTYVSGGSGGSVLGFDPEAVDSEDLIFGWITPPFHLRH